MNLERKTINRIIAIASFVMLLYVVWLNVPHHLQRARAELPSTTEASGTLSLITEPNDGMAPIFNTIKNATKSLDLVIYELDDKDIADALIDAHNRGVAVRVMLNKKFYMKAVSFNQPSYTYLESRGIDVEWAPIYFTYTHQKTLIADDNTALIMTFNLVPKYYASGRDFGVIDTNPHDVQAIEDAFNADWNGDNTPADTADDLVWSPGSENDMLLIINSAKSSLDVYNEEMEDAPVTKALEDAVARGVNVKIVMSYATRYKPVFTELKNAGAHVSLFHGTKRLYIHAKAILADERYAFVGSENFSPTSLTKNRELGIFFSDTTLVSSLKNTFERDFGNGKEW